MVWRWKAYSIIRDLLIVPQQKTHFCEQYAAKERPLEGEMERFRQSVGSVNTTALLAGNPRKLSPYRLAFRNTRCGTVVAVVRPAMLKTH